MRQTSLSRPKENAVRQVVPDAQFSIPYTVGVAVIKGECGHRRFYT